MHTHVAQLNCQDGCHDFYPNFAFIFAVFVWKRHFLFFIWKEILKMIDIMVQMNAGK